MSIQITECPRDAMQGVEQWIPTELKTKYLNTLLSVGFDVLDFGSFVSPKAIPQLRDTAQVLDGLNLGTKTKLLAIIANERGALDACKFEPIHFLGYPFSISETFQKRNTNSTIEQSLARVDAINAHARKANKHPLIYISMAFGNPYGDKWSPEMAAEWIQRLHREFDITEFALADTVGVSTEENIKQMFEMVLPEFPKLRIGAHLHATAEDTSGKVQAAYDSGCRNFDSAIKGLGGCPMAEDDLVGNVATEILFKTLNSSEIEHIDQNQFADAMMLSNEVFL
ncbi:MAG TPA: hydroxymethylglutaryl-CoA lyase [Flavobacteriales bacterium]|jgi:hydroxymethylglutaryl-CoA lyase|nr:hydroxymethylglutaryl-CoA lyase [Flavobacteriales bacterium]HAW20674.1 hydroxymethylglutaryl-CoA lyase [Flavobacteriales bacterium]